MITRRSFAQILARTAAGAALSGCMPMHAGTRSIRLGMSLETLAGSNINDARAAFKVWAQEITHSFGLSQISLVPEVFIPSGQMIEMIRSGAVDGFVITAWEYAQAIDVIDLDWIILQDYAVEGLDYLLLVHQTSPFQKLADLRGKQLTSYHHLDTVLLKTWLELLLAGNNLGTASHFFGDQVSRTALNEVVLPVFFRRVEAAAVTRRAFDVAAELNPQLSRDLRVLAASPKMIPALFCVRRDCPAEDKKQIRDALLNLKSLAAGQQLLLMYQTRGFRQRPSSCMKDTLDLLRQYQRLHMNPEGAHRRSASDT